MNPLILEISRLSKAIQFKLTLIAFKLDELEAIDNTANATLSSSIVNKILNADSEYTYVLNPSFVNPSEIV